METFTDVFERKEIKYRLSACQHQAMVAALAGIMVPDEFGCTPIVSVYFDTPTRSLIDRSLERPVYKEKLRLRSYGAPHEDDRVFVELKKKFEGIVYKRRVGMSYAAARAYLGGLSYGKACAQYPLPDLDMASESLASRSFQNAREIDRFIVHHRPLRSSMVIACRRTAYRLMDTPGPGCEVDDVRITFDEEVAYRDLFSPNPAGPSHPLMEKGQAIMEIKSAGPFPLWLVQALGGCQAYPSSFSKYGEAYRACANAMKAQGGKAVPASHAEDSSFAPNLGHFETDLVDGRGCEAVRAEAEERGECLMSGTRDVRRRRFSAPRHAVKNGGRCA